jgi:hypothetical protein
MNVRNLRLRGCMDWIFYRREQEKMSFAELILLCVNLRVLMFSAVNLFSAVAVLPINNYLCAN